MKRQQVEGPEKIWPDGYQSRREMQNMSDVAQELMFIRKDVLALLKDAKRIGVGASALANIDCAERHLHFALVDVKEDEERSQELGGADADTNTR